MDTSNPYELRVRELDNLISLAAPHRQLFALLAAIASLHAGALRTNMRHLWLE
jgi:hypothetical protein